MCFCIKAQHKPKLNRFSLLILLPQESVEERFNQLTLTQLLPKLKIQELHKILQKEFE